tara:strand:+ start:457 stop:579 length:123 start_codon:yes stop_codon:yes gene_type:complete
MSFKKERNTIKVCEVCGEDFKPDETGHYECKTVKESDNER